MALPLTDEDARRYVEGIKHMTPEAADEFMDLISGRTAFVTRLFGVPLAEMGRRDDLMTFRWPHRPPVIR